MSNKKKARTKMEDFNSVINKLLADGNGLSAREQQVLRYRLIDNKTLQQVGTLWAMSRERVRQIEEKAYWKLGMGTSKDSINALKKMRKEKWEQEVNKLLKLVEPIRLKEKKPFTQIFKDLGLKHSFLTVSVARKFYDKYPMSTPEGRVLNDRDRKMIEYKQKHPYTTQVELAKMFNVYAGQISRKFQHMGIKWNDVRKGREYTQPMIQDGINKKVH